MHHPTDRITHTTAFVTPVVEHWLEQEIAQWVHPMKDQSDDPSHHERTFLPRSHISLPRSVSALQADFVHPVLSRERDVAISRSSQCSTTGVTKAVVCAILSVGWCI